MSTLGKCSRRGYGKLHTVPPTHGKQNFAQRFPYRKRYSAKNILYTFASDMVAASRKDRKSERRVSKIVWLSRDGIRRDTVTLSPDVKGR